MSTFDGIYKYVCVCVCVYVYVCECLCVHIFVMQPCDVQMYPTLYISVDNHKSMHKHDYI